MSRYKGLTNEATRKMSLHDKIMWHTRQEDGHLIWEGQIDGRGLPRYHATNGKARWTVMPRNYLFKLAHPELKRPQVHNDKDLCGRPDCILPEHQRDAKRMPKPGRYRGYRVKQIRNLRASLVPQLLARGYTASEVASGLGLPLNIVTRVAAHKK